jgi:hypothetical protein
MTISSPHRLSAGRPRAGAALWRWLLALLIGLIALAYAVAVVTGGINKDHRIDTSVLASIAFAWLAGVLLVKPGLLGRVLGHIGEFKALGVSVKLDRVEEQQAKQQEQLEYFSLTLAALLPPPEQAHILKLEDKFNNAGEKLTAGYTSTSELYSQLSHLRSLGLIEMQPDPADKDGRKHMRHLRRQQGEFDLADWVRLTDLGHRWAVRIKEVDQRTAKAAAHP